MAYLRESPARFEVFARSSTAEQLQEVKKLIMEQEQSAEWRKYNLEYDLRSTDWIAKKVCESNEYAAALNSVLCDHSFIKNETWPLLTDAVWSCTWRYAGEIIANIREGGSYLDWYMNTSDGRTAEIIEDLTKLGWIVVREQE